MRSGIMRRVSGRDVAQVAGVSLNTVSLVVRNSPLVAPATKARVQEVIERLGYQPHAAAAALASARTHTLGYLMRPGVAAVEAGEVQAIVDFFRNQLLNAIIGRAQQADHHVLTTFAGSSRFLSLLGSGRIDGVLCDWLIDNTLLKQVMARGVPFVVVGRDAGNLPVSWVKADEEGGAYEATRHLLALGHRRVGLIAVDHACDNRLAQERVRGYTRALTEADIPLEPQYTGLQTWTFQSGYELGTTLLSRHPRPTALFILSEVQSAGTLKAAADLGLHVPDDVAIATTEDSPLVEYVRPRLTAVHVPMYEVGLRATEILLSLLEDATAAPQQIVLPTRVVVRESSASVADRAISVSSPHPAVPRVEQGGAGA